MTYERPHKGAGFAPSEHPEWLGHLFLIWPESWEEVTFTRPDGTPDPTIMVTADVAIPTLTDPQTGQPVFIQGARIGGKALAGQLKPRAKPGAEVLGKFAQAPKQPGKNAAFLLDFPDETPQGAQEWALMCKLADEYKAAHPRVSQAYQAPAQSNGAPAWNTPAQSAPSPQAAPSWGASAPSQAPAPATWGAPAPASPPTNGWGQGTLGAATAASEVATPAVQNGVGTWPPGLADFLTSKGYDLTQIPDESTARQIAATLAT